MNLIKKIKFINSFSFIFSPRPGTVAENLELIRRDISLKRLEKVQEYLAEYQLKKNKSLENRVIKVLVENQTKDKLKLFGRSEYLTSVILDGSIKYIGQIVHAQILRSNRNTLFGKIIKNFDKKVA